MNLLNKYKMDRYKVLNIDQYRHTIHYFRINIHIQGNLMLLPEKGNALAIQRQVL